MLGTIMKFKPTQIISRILLFLTLQGCSQSNSNEISIPLPHLNLKETKLLANDKDLEEQHGCIVTNTTEGAHYLKEIENESLLSSKEWIEVYLSILTRNEFYHLHNIAGIKLAKVSSVQSVILKQDSLPENSFAYIVSRMVYSTNGVTDSHPKELSIDQINVFIKLLRDNDINNTDKVYFLNALYSCSFKTETGVLIDSLVRNIELDSNVFEQNRKLFERYKNIKPQFENLDLIHTWKEMDKNKNKIGEFLQSTDPLLFYQILGFNPSTVLDSKEFCQLKKETLLSILTQDYVGDQLFYVSYVNAFKPELLNYDFYTVRFLQRIMTKEEFISFRNTFGTNK